MPDEAFFTVRGLTVRQDNGEGKAILHNLDLDVAEGEVIILRGPSGCGKTTLLRCLAELNVYQKGEILLHGKRPIDYSIPKYRTLVQYVPQRPSLLPGTPLDFLAKLRSFAARQRPSNKSSLNHQYGATSHPDDNDTELDPIELARQWGIEKTMWQRDWGTLSGGEAQRVALAVAVGIGGAEILLLDEPTSALDEESSLKVEKTLLSLLPPLKSKPIEVNGVRRRSHGGGPKALIWITHSAEQAERCGTRYIDLSNA